MEIQELIKQRYSVRAYKSDPVEDAKLEQILEAARMAPTAANRQPFRLLVIRTKGKESDLRKIYNREWFTQAPIIICVVSLPEIAWVRYDGANYVNVDAAIVMDHMILTATSLGLGTCWVGAFNPTAAREVLRLPDQVEPIVFTPLGYPADNPKEKERKNLTELVRYDHW